MIKLKRKITYIAALLLFMAIAPSLQATQPNTSKLDSDTRHYPNSYLVEALNLRDISPIVIRYISDEDPDFINLLGLTIRLAYPAHAQQLIRKAEKETVLLRSAQEGHLGCVKYLVTQGAERNTKNKNGDTPLMLSAQNGHLACLKYLFEQGADIHTQNEHGNTALIWSAYEGHFPCLKYLHQQGADIDAKNNYGDTALCLSILHDNLDCVMYLRQQGAK